MILVNGCVVVNWHIPANIDLFKVNKRNTRKMYEIYSKLTMKAQKRCRLILYCLKIPENQRFFSVLRGCIKWDDVVLLSLLKTLTYFTLLTILSIAEIEQVDI